MRCEPVLNESDLRAWNTWRMAAIAHARTREHARMVDGAKRVVEQAMRIGSNWLGMWSGGKDSTALSHLLVSELGIRVPLVSEKDDLDYPGEREYVTGIAENWKAGLRIVTPSISPAEWMAKNACRLDGDADMHSRAAELSKACFYSLVEKANAGSDGIFLGLRKEESRGRMLNRATNGLIYEKRDGMRVAQPIADWSGIDVYAYLLKRQIPLFSVYQCIGLMHAHEPWRVRKSWWIPGAAGRHGQVTWLRHYWPSLYEKLVDWLPNTKAFG